MTKKIIIYTKEYCPHCVYAKNLFDKLGHKYEEIDISNDENLQIEVKNKSGRMTIPQIFIGNIHVGGNDDLQELYKKGELKALIEKEIGA